jgi:hypothetical protein
MSAILVLKPCYVPYARNNTEVSKHKVAAIAPAAAEASSGPPEHFQTEVILCQAALRQVLTPPALQCRWETARKERVSVCLEEP